MLTGSLAFSARLSRKTRHTPIQDGVVESATFRQGTVVYIFFMTHSRVSPIRSPSPSVFTRETRSMAPLRVSLSLINLTLRARLLLRMCSDPSVNRTGKRQPHDHHSTGAHSHCDRLTNAGRWGRRTWNGETGIVSKNARPFAVDCDLVAYFQNYQLVLICMCSSV